MEKLKVGDRVRTIREDIGIDVGTTGTVIEVYGGIIVRVEFDYCKGNRQDKSWRSMLVSSVILEKLGETKAVEGDTNKLIRGVKELMIEIKICKWG